MIKRKLLSNLQYVSLFTVSRLIQSRHIVIVARYRQMIKRYCPIYNVSLFTVSRLIQNRHFVIVARCWQMIKRKLLFNLRYMFVYFPCVRLMQK